MIKAPFNFVPLSEKVYYPDWANIVSHDVPFEDGEDGLVKLTIKSVSPLFVRDGAGRDENSAYSSHVMLNGERRYFIPGTSLKGCFRSVLEIISFGKLEQFNNDSFAMPRAFDTKQSTNNPYLKAIKGRKCGWLYQADERYIITPCSQGIQEINHGKLIELFPGFDKGQDQQTAERKQRSLEPDGELFPIVDIEDGKVSLKNNNQVKWVPSGSYKVVCTGYMNGKSHEYLFSCEEEASLPVSDEVFKAFDSVHRRTEYYGGRNGNPGFLKKLLLSGERIPVFYTTDSGKVSAIGITKMMRYPYTYNIKDAIENCRMKPDDTARPDLAQTIFGYTMGKEDLKGRIQIGHAFCDAVIPDNSLVPICGVLGQPSASFYPLYLRPADKKYQTFADRGVQIAGRKRYRVAKGGKTFALPQGNGNENVLCHFNALPSNQTFRCSISVHNLRMSEIGALLSALTFNGTPDTYHNIGLAKSFGYGKIVCDVELKGLEHSVGEYLRAFELELMEHGFVLQGNPALNSLVAIASEHPDSEMYMMNLEEYGNSKNNKEFSIQTEGNKCISTLATINDLEEKRKKKAEAEVAIKQTEKDRMNLVNCYELAKQAMAHEQWSVSLTKLQEALYLTKKLGDSDKEIVEMTRTCQEKLTGIQNAPLSSTLEGKSSLGNIAGTTAKWAKSNQITENEIETLYNTISALSDKELRSLTKKRQDFVKAIGSEWTDVLYNQLTSK